MILLKVFRLALCRWIRARVFGINTMQAVCHLGGSRLRIIGHYNPVAPAGFGLIKRHVSTLKEAVKALP